MTAPGPEHQAQNGSAPQPPAQSAPRKKTWLLVPALCVMISFAGKPGAAVGSLSAVGPQGQVLFTEEHVARDGWLWMDDLQAAVYLDQNQNLMLRTPGQEESALLAENISWESVRQAGEFLAYEEDQEPDRVMGNVNSYTVYEGGAIRGENSAGTAFIHAGGETDYPSVHPLGVCQNPEGSLVFYGGKKELWMWAPKLDPVLLDDAMGDENIILVSWAQGSGALYYQKGEALYRMQLPDYSQKDLEDWNTLNMAGDIEALKLDSGVTRCEASLNGENLAWLNQRGELQFFCLPFKEGKTEPEPVDMADRVKDFMIKKTDKFKELNIVSRE